ncbi:MAG: AI-2E family transporter [Opitutus sp.]
MSVAKPSNSIARFVTFASVVLVIAALRLAEEVIIPIALSFLLAFLLSPIVVRLMRLKLPRSVAIIATAGLAFLVIGVATWQIAMQAVSLVGELPGYEKNLHQKISVFQHPVASGTLSRSLNTIEQMWTDLQGKAAPVTPPTAAGAPLPVPVEVKSTTRSSFDLARDILGHLVKPLGTAGIVVVFVIAILFQTQDLRNRLIRVVSGGQLNIATEAVDDAAQRVSSYLLAQLLVNTCFGIVIGLGLWAIGIPHAPLWGLLSTLLRFIPFLGPMIAASFPLVLSVAVDPGWAMLWWTGALFVAAELVTSNVIEVLVYGTSTGISTLALLVAAVFWTWVWGLPGLFLSTPLTVCLLVLGQYVSGLKFLSVLLGSEPPLQPSARFYQSMLSMNQEDMFDVASEYVEQHTLAAFYDDVFVPALLMSEVDRHNGVLAEVRQKFIFESGRELVEELTERTDAAKKKAAAKTESKSPAQITRIVGIPARDEADELVALMLSHLLQEHSIETHVVSTTSQPEMYREELKPQNVTVFISALPPSTLSGAGRACRRIKHENPSAKVLVGVWSSEAKHEALKRRLDPAGVDGIVSRLSEAVVQLKNLIAGPSEVNVPSKETESTQAAERTELKLAAAKPEEATDTVTRELARAFNVPISLVSVIETDRDFWRASPASGTVVSAAESSLYESVLVSDHPVVVDDVEKDERYSQNPLLEKRGVRFFASTPLRLRNGHHVGNLCILDTQPRTFGDKERELLDSLAAQLMDAVEPETSVPFEPAAS